MATLMVDPPCISQEPFSCLGEYSNKQTTQLAKELGRLKYKSKKSKALFEKIK